MVVAVSGKSIMLREKSRSFKVVRHQCIMLNELHCPFNPRESRRAALDDASGNASSAAAASSAFFDNISYSCRPTCLTQSSALLLSQIIRCIAMANGKQRMAGFETDIHALIEDINGNYGETPYEHQQLPYSRPHSKSYQSQNGQLQDPRQTPASSYAQQPLYVAQASTPYYAHLDSLYQEVGLDAYGALCKSSRTIILLIVPQTELSWLSVNLKDHGRPAVA